MNNLNKLTKVVLSLSWTIALFLGVGFGFPTEVRSFARQGLSSNTTIQDWIDVGVKNQQVVKRDGEAHSTLSGSDYAIESGKDKPEDLVHKAYDLCKEYMCDDIANTITVGNIEIRASGQYNGWDQRNFLLEGLLEFVRQDQTYDVKKSPRCMNVGAGNMACIDDAIDVSQWSGNNYYGIQRFEGDSLQQYLRVDLIYHDPAAGFCEFLMESMGAAVGLIPGMGEVGAFLGPITSQGC